MVGGRAWGSTGTYLALVVPAPDRAIPGSPAGGEGIHIGGVGLSLGTSATRGPGCNGRQLGFPGREREQGPEGEVTGRVRGGGLPAHCLVGWISTSACRSRQRARCVPSRPARPLGRARRARRAGCRRCRYHGCTAPTWTGGGRGWVVYTVCGCVTCACSCCVCV